MDLLTLISHIIKIIQIQTIRWDVLPLLVNYQTLTSLIISNVGNNLYHLFKETKAPRNRIMKFVEDLLGIMGERVNQ